MALSENEKKQEKREKPPTKIVVRRLPPTIDQETFLKQVSPIPDYNYIYTVNGDSSLGEFAFSRVYFNFVNHEDVYNFKERFDNYLFLDSKGQEYPCVVEFASFQKTPKKRGKVRMDPKAGTIESDPTFLEFAESLKKTPEPEEKAEYSLQLTSENKNEVTTPLLEYLKNKRAQRMKIREVRREERKRREFDKRKDRYDDRKKGVEEKYSMKEAKPKGKLESPKFEKVEDHGKIEVKSEKTNDGPDKVLPKTDKEYDKSERVYEKSYKTKERKYEDKRFDDRRKEIKPRYPRKDYSDHMTEELKVKDSSSNQKFDYRKESDSKPNSKKVKKYSEKREERKIEAQKAEKKRIEQINEAKEDVIKNEKSIDKKSEEKLQKSDLLPEKKTKSEEKVSNEVRPTQEAKEPYREKAIDANINEKGQSQHRIRNKDRPTIAIYRPGMLSKRKQNDTDTNIENKDSKSEDQKSNKE